MFADWYLWIKAFHIMAVIGWMAGLFYLPRLYVYHAEHGSAPDVDRVLQIMELKLLRVIMNPAMIATWVAGLALVVTPGVVVWSMIWPWVKLFGIVGMTGFHMWLANQRKLFVSGNNETDGRHFRLMNEVPTVLMFLIVVSVVIKF